MHTCLIISCFFRPSFTQVLLISYSSPTHLRINIYRSKCWQVEDMGKSSEKQGDMPDKTIMQGGVCLSCRLR